MTTRLDLLGPCLGAQPALPAPRLRQLMLEQVMRHIDAHLTEASLDVHSIAQAFRMGERNLHKLFEATDSTVSAYVRERRPAMCRRDLESSTLARRQITEIAGHWGFEDSELLFTNHGPLAFLDENQGVKMILDWKFFADRA